MASTCLSPRYSARRMGENSDAGTFRAETSVQRTVRAKTDSSLEALAPCRIQSGNLSWAANWTERSKTLSDEEERILQVREKETIPRMSASTRIADCLLNPDAFSVGCCLAAFIETPVRLSEAGGLRVY